MKIEPKIFYRELDALLAKVKQVKSDSNFFRSILAELMQTFQEKLGIVDAHIYERRGDEFAKIILNSAHSDSKLLPETISAFSNLMCLVVKHGSYLFDWPDERFPIQAYAESRKIIPAGIRVQRSEQQWVFLFDLKDATSREEILLFLNALRTALNYRMFSEVMQTEIDMAVQIQKSLLPRNPPQVEGFDIAHFTQPAESVGGDFYEYYQFDPKEFGISLGDASGHGLPAALLVRDVVIGLRMGLHPETRIEHSLSKLNEVIQRSTYSTSFVSLFIGEYQGDGQLFYINAGHPPPILMKKNDVQMLEATGIALGFLRNYSWKRSYVQFDPGDVLVVYSDGIVERENKKGEHFNHDRLQEIMMDNKKKSAQELIDIIVNTVFSYGDQSVWADDATLMVVKRT